MLKEHADATRDGKERTNLKGLLAKIHTGLHDLEAAARKLQNQNFADIVKSAKGKVHQLTGHPDLDKVQALQDDKPGTMGHVFKAELATLERSGDGDTERAEELRGLIKSAEAQKPAPGEAVVERGPFPGTPGEAVAGRGPFPGTPDDFPNAEPLPGTPGEAPMNAELLPGQTIEHAS